MRDVEAPTPTICAGGTHIAEVRAFLTKYYGADQNPRLTEPLHTATTRARFGLVTVAIGRETYCVTDIGMRMLTPPELYRTNGFPASYVIDRGSNGLALTKTSQIRMCGNAVCPPVAAAIVAANYRDEARARQPRPTVPALVAAE